MLQKPPPVLVADRFPLLLDSLLNLLGSLTNEEWFYPVHGGEWTVKDLAQHLLGDEINILSGKRDRFSENQSPIHSWAELVAWINHRNALWVEATRRMSPPVICELLKSTGMQANEFFRTADPYAMGGAVSWAGPEPAPVWLDIAREFTERWHHQQHIRCATGKPGCNEAYFLSPVLATFVRALPQTFQAVDAPEHTVISVTMTGEVDEVWSVMREQNSWQLFLGKPTDPQAEVHLSQITAWQLFTKGISKEEARAKSVLSGDAGLAARVLETTSIIA